MSVVIVVDNVVVRGVTIVVLVTVSYTVMWSGDVQVDVAVVVVDGMAGRAGLLLELLVLGKLIQN